jgi:flavin-dependent dehydrogenase
VSEQADVVVMGYGPAGAAAAIAAHDAGAEAAGTQDAQVPR